MANYRVWYSTESFADYIIDNTVLKSRKAKKKQLYESDASKPRNFHTIPDHIKKILYLDAPDLIVESDMEPIFSIEITTEAGTGHNAFQRFARIAAAAENGVPAIYIYPEAVIISRQKSPTKWDSLNPLTFKALERINTIYNIPALLFYYPSDYTTCPTAINSQYLRTKGLIQEPNIIKYPGCPISSDSQMQHLFKVLNDIIIQCEKSGTINGLSKINSCPSVVKQTDWIKQEFFRKAGLNVNINTLSPLSACKVVPTSYLLSHLKQYGQTAYSELLASRKETLIYQVDAAFRADPYPGALSAIDYLKCRSGKTFEEREYNLVLCWGSVVEDHIKKIISINSTRHTSVNDFIDTVKNCSRQNLLTKSYSDLSTDEIPRYYMQVRYGSTYSKVKHIRVYSYFADAILFEDGALWRNA